MGNVIVWADIPVIDMQRATKFYSEVTQLPVVGMPGAEAGVALIGGDGEGGTRVSADLYVGGQPSHSRTTVYLSSNGDLDGMVSRVQAAGGKVLEEKQYMGDMVGWIAFIEDSEGNRIGIQQPGDGM